MNRKTDRSWHHLPADEAARLLDVNLSTGLSAAEVRRRRQEYGPNIITARRGPSPWTLFARQFHQPLVYILLVAVAVAALLGEWVDSSVISGVVLVNAIVGFLQETKAGKSIEGLNRMITTTATVLRDACKLQVHSEDLVPGDIVLLHSGDRVPADVRLFRSRNLHVDESALTGESLPVPKHPDTLAPDTILAERGNLAYSGTLVTSGQAESIVWATGDRTETGRIAHLISSSIEISTPLTKKIGQFSKLLVRVILLLAAVTFSLGVARGESAADMFMAAVALSVGAIPEGLPAAVTIVLAIGVSRMAKRQAIIRRLPAVETLGSTTVICSDKTGTLTENQMSVREILAGGTIYQVSGTGYEPAGDILLDGRVVELAEHPALAECLRAGVLCNDSQLILDNGRHEAQGDPTEAALLVAAEKAGLVRHDTHLESPVLDSIPFESGHMFRATLHDASAGRVIYQVGALERLLAGCSDALGAEGSLVPLDKDAVHREAEKLASRGLRILAMARRHMAADHPGLEHANIAGGLTFLGLQGMMDPPRPEAITAVKRCQEAGIAVKMITGDHLATARAIARQIGLEKNGELIALSGRELDDIADEDLPEAADRTTVFARVAPEQKLRIVRALQASGHIVAMTGDGVNDAPALKQADIGVAMGVTGTDVAKAAAAMVLTNDRFSSIEAAVEEGRGVFDNLTKFIVWTLPTNGGEAAILLAAIVFDTLLPALPVQLLWINMTTAVLLGLTLVFEPKENDLMTRPPRDPKRPLLTFPLLMRTGLVTLIMLVGAFWLFFHELKAEGQTEAAARTAVVNVIVAVEITYLFCCRSLHRPVFTIGWFSNRWVLAGSLAMLAAQFLLTYSEVMNRLFHTAPISAGSWLRIALVALVTLIAVELEKWIRFGLRHKGRVIPE